MEDIKSMTMTVTDERAVLNYTPETDVITAL